MEKAPQTEYLPTTFTIFGITGDLSRRKLLPSIFHLFRHGLLPEHIEFIGLAIEEKTTEEFHALIADSLRTFVDGTVEENELTQFVSLFSYLQSDITKRDAYDVFQKRMHDSDKKCDAPHQSIFYLAVAPHFFIPIIEHLDASHLTGPCPEYDVKAKIVIEKPFGRDVESAAALNETVLKYADEDQIYRMDHYLGKETVQNMLLFRFTNPVINDSWNPKAIERIEIIASENIGVEQRASYYDTAGALRDMVQSHGLALLSLVTMDEPNSLQSKDIHEKKQEMFETISIFDENNIESSALRGQYEGYTQSDGVAPDSTTETFAQLRLKSSHPQWKDVPMYITTGKMLASKETRVQIHFTPCQSNICKTQGIRTEPNILELRVQPQEGISLKLFAKKPGFYVETQEVEMTFDYNASFSDEQPSPYERLIHDVIIGDQSLFPSTEEVMDQWRIIQPILDTWTSSHDHPPIYTYPKGSHGPAESKQFLS